MQYVAAKTVEQEWNSIIKNGTDWETAALKSQFRPLAKANGRERFRN